MVIYADNMSQPGRAVICFCKLTGIEFELSEVSVLSGEQFSPAFKKLNPKKLIPVLVETDLRTGERFILTESHSILRYLALTRASTIPQNWYP